MRAWLLQCHHRRVSNSSLNASPSHTNESTRAVGLVTFGGPEVLHVVSRPVPALGAEDVRIRVEAAAVNPTDLIFRSGARAEVLSAFEPPYVPGVDAAGVIEAVGASVTHLSPGDRVAAFVNPFRAEGGAQSEVIVVPAASVARIPSGLATQAAATIPMNGLTALESLDMLALPEGGTLAITGGTGWVATLAISLAKSRKLRVVADAPLKEFDRVRALGADHVIERGGNVAEKIRAVSPGGVDAVLDTAMVGPSVLAAVRDGGGWAVFRQQQDETERGIVRHNVSGANRMSDVPALERLLEAAASGHLPMTIAGTYNPEQAADAHRRQDAGGIRGRLLIVF